MNDSLIQNLIVNLKVLSKVEEDGKVSSTGQSLQIEISNKWWMQTLKRTLYGDNRNIDYDFINNIINQTIECSRMLITDMTTTIELGIDRIRSNTKDRFVNNWLDLGFLRDGLHDSINGINNLIKTYRKDQTIVAKLEVMINRINTEVRKINLFLNRHESIYTKLQDAPISPKPSKENDSDDDNIGLGIGFND